MLKKHLKKCVKKTVLMFSLVKLNYLVKITRADIISLSMSRIKLRNFPCRNSRKFSKISPVFRQIACPPDGCFYLIRRKEFTRN